MGRRKKADIEQALELSNEVEATQEETNEEPVEKDDAAVEAKEEKKPKAAKKPRRRRSPRKPKAAPGLSILNAADESEEPKEIEKEEPKVEVSEEPTMEATDTEGTEVENPPTPARGRGRSRKPAGDEPDFKKDLVAAASASQKSVDAMAKQWENIKEMTSAISSQLEKSSQTIKGIPETIIEAHPELVKNPAQRSQLISKFAIAASVVAVILSLLSLSLSQSARQAVLSAEVARAAQSMAVAKAVTAPAPKVSEDIAALPFEKAPVKKVHKRYEVYGPPTPNGFGSRK